MIVSPKEIIDIYEEAYKTEKQAADLDSQKKALLKAKDDSFKDYAKSNEIDLAGFKNAYKDFKAHKENRVTNDNEDYFSLLAIIEGHFAGEEEDLPVSM